MSSYRRCTNCGQLCEKRGVSRCETCAPYGWQRPARPLPSNWTAIRTAKLRANPACEVCGAKAATVDHIQARARGGSEDAANLRSLCAACAKAKDRADREEGRRLAAMSCETLPKKFSVAPKVSQPTGGRGADGNERNTAPWSNASRAPGATSAPDFLLA